ncbi:Formyl transferase [Propionispira arboris]|uniref:Formyl transferase n=2 Tax=Propionispira arboris TaxID=84035 RepID=A0A1H7CE20_9FIRM|nr:Formyl transferase [Propionispira arboris]
MFFYSIKLFNSDRVEGGKQIMVSYNIAIVYDQDSWITSYVDILEEKLVILGHQVKKLYHFDKKNRYDFVFLLSYSEIVKKEFLQLNKHNLVVHESDLPKGKGWSPLTWQILEGKTQIPITLFEATEKVDNGEIYLQKNLMFDGFELIGELREVQGNITIELCLDFVCDYEKIVKKRRKQIGKGTYYSKRLPSDSNLDINKTIKEQFNLLRVVDNKKYPAYFEMENHKYILEIRKEY